MARAFAAASSEYLETASTPVAAVPITQACWFNSTSTSASQDVFSVNSGGFGGGSDSWRMALIGGQVRTQILNNSGQNHIDTTTSYSASTWHHGCSVHEANSRTSYLDGGGSATDNNTRTPADIDRVSMGIRYDTAQYMSGNIAECGLWNVALTAAEVAILAEGYSPLFVRPASLVGYWPLIGNFSPEIDLVGGRGAVLNNTPTTAAHPRVIYPVGPLPQPFVAAAPGGLSIPIAAYHYNHNVGSNL